MRPIERPSRSASFQLPLAGVTITSTVNPSSRKPSGTRLVERVNEVPRRAWAVSSCPVLRQAAPLPGEPLVVETGFKRRLNDSEVWRDGEIARCVERVVPDQKDLVA